MSKPTKSTKAPPPLAPEPAPADAQRKNRKTTAKGAGAAGPRAKKTADSPKTKTPSPRQLAAALDAPSAAPGANPIAARATSPTVRASVPLDAQDAPAVVAAGALSSAAETAREVPRVDEENDVIGDSPAQEFDGAPVPDVPFAERVRLRSGVVELLVFRVGTELFAAALPAIEEALELPSLSHLPEMPPSMLGVISLRGRMLPAYSPARPLGVALARADAAALVVRAGERRVALAVDDVDDVMTVDLTELRPPPILAGEERDTVLLGVAARGGDLVAVLDADALVTACLSDQALEIA